MPLDDNSKLKCEDCDWRGTQREMLKAPNPFDPEYEVVGCPRCKSIATLHYVCDAQDCWQLASCGWPSPQGYRNTCGKHWLKEHKVDAPKETPPT